MARILKTRSGGFRIDLDGPVGTGSRNARDDVGTVQECLRLLSTGQQGPLGRTGGGFFDPPDGARIAVDGFFGPQTAAYINAYQVRRQAFPSPGTLGPMPPPNGVITSTRGPGPWSFSVIDSDAQEQNKTSVLDAILTDPAAPAFLKAVYQM